MRATHPVRENHQGAFSFPASAAGKRTCAIGRGRHVRRFAFRVAVLAWTLLVVAERPATAGPLLITGFESQLESWVAAGDLVFTNIFTKTAGDTALDFHAAVDGQGPTFTLIEAIFGTETFILGGYNPLSWSSDGTFNVASTDAERAAFIFNLTTGVRQGERLTSDPFDPSIGEFQTFNSADYGPYFGAGPDLFVGPEGNVIGAPLNLGIAFQGSYGSGAPCGGLGGINILGICSTLPAPGQDLPGQFVVGAMEVYTTAPAPVPEPTSLVLMTTGFAGLIGTRCRQRARSRRAKVAR